MFDFSPRSLGSAICATGDGTVTYVKEDALRAHGHRMLISSLQVDEAPPQAWHRRVGFEEIAILAGIDEGGVGEVFFRRNLV